MTQAPQIAPDADPAAALGARVKVRYPWLSDSNESNWARVLTPMSGSGMGIYFMPDEGDTVMVAFQDGDFTMPVVIGSVWDGTALPPVYPPAFKNSVRMIKSRSGHTIKLDDTTGMEKVVITHKGGSEITLDFDGSVSVTATSNLNLKANGTITLDAAAVDVKVKTTMNVH